MPDEELRVVLASNRGPVSFVATDGGFELKRGAGGLAGALDPVARELGENATWIASATSESDRAALAAGATGELRDQLGYRVYLLDIDPDTYARYYDVVSNRMLWFANHCLWDELEIRGFGEGDIRAWDEAYEAVNRRFATAAAEASGPDAIVLFQDYHLTTAPRYLREMRPEQTIFHFTHSSFCCPGLDRLPDPIPERVMRGMLAADLLGFHTPRWIESFFECCDRIGVRVDREAGSVETGGRRTWVRAYPITIDSSELQTRADGRAAKRWADRFRGEGDRVLIVRADRAEPSKNIVRGFEAFGALLDRRPDLRDRTRFVACLYPSRQTMPEYRSYIERIERAAEEVNERHAGSIDLYMKDDFDRTLGALLVYDVLIVNSIMDGMNLVSKEGPTINTRSGSLVLSRGAGSFAELGELAIGIDDPYDVEETTRALEQAIELGTDEREERAAALRALIGGVEPAHWIESQLEDLVSIKQRGSPASSL